MARLRGPEGCPWDREQSYRTLRGYLIEECYEVAEALDNEDPDGLCEELGDLLFQIVFLARIAEEEGRFDVHDVARGIEEKMIRRHPHVFGDESAQTSDEVLKNWETIKREEKRAAGRAPRRSLLDGLPKGLPALQKAQRLGEKAARVGFDWDHHDAVLRKVDEELAEVRRALRAGSREQAREEVGDLLFATVNLARHLELDPESALQRTNHKFKSRFAWMEGQLAATGEDIASVGSKRLEQLWEASKEVGP